MSGCCGGKLTGIMAESIMDNVVWRSEMSEGRRDGSWYFGHHMKYLVNGNLTE